VSEVVSQKKTSESLKKKYPYGAPELVNGGLPSFASDKYSFAKIGFLQKEESNFQLSSVHLTLAINRALGPDPTTRPVACFSKVPKLFG